MNACGKNHQASCYTLHNSDYTIDRARVLLISSLRNLFPRRLSTTLMSGLGDGVYHFESTLRMRA